MHSGVEHRGGEEQGKCQFHDEDRLHQSECPVARAPACSPNPTMIAAIPAHHPGLCARTHIMARPEAEASGCSRATLRCSTDEHVLANAAAVANATLSSTATARQAHAGWDDPARIPAGVDVGPRTPC